MEARPQRSRQQVARFAPTESKTEKSALEISAGSGTQISDIPFVVEQLAKLKADEDAVKNVHQLFFRQPGTKTNRKKNIRQFSGFPEGANGRDANIERIAHNKTKYTVAALKDMCGLLGLERSGSREELVERLVDFAISPVATKGTKRKAVTSSSNGVKKTKGKRAKKDGSKKGTRGPNSFMLFTKDIRASVVAENPGLATKDIARVIGERWRALSEEEKEEYKEKAAAIKAERANGDAHDEEDDHHDDEEQEDEEEGKEAEDEDDDEDA